ncbi:MAG: universal stress protein [Inquilinus sp.]|nr:universal stress protein [Inquilinus sp.]
MCWYRLLDYLAWHGIEARSVELAKRPKQAAAIVSEALGAGCDLVILGAYIHARAHDLLFGGMTEYVLSDAKLPALLVP